MLAPMTSSPVRARPAVAAAFAAQGLLFISLTTRLPTLQDTWDLGEVGLSLLLLMMVLLAGAGSLVAEGLAKRSHSAAVLRGGLLVVAVAVPLLVTAPTFAVFVAGLAAYGVGLGLVDAAGNMQAVAVEHAYGRPILPSFHGAWTAGGVVAAGLTLVDPDLWLAAALGVVPARGRVRRPFLPRVGEPDTGRRGGAVAADRAGRPGDGALLHGRHRGDHVGTDVPRQHVPDAGPAGRAGDVPLPAGHAGDAAGRRRPGRPVRRRCRCSAPARVVASASLFVIVVSPSWQVAVVGFTLLGVGVAVIAPLSFSAAARIAGGRRSTPAIRQARVDVVIGRFNQFNYVGALLGAVLTGLVGADSLRVGFAVPMVLVLVILPLAKNARLTRPRSYRDFHGSAY